jgi:transposase
MLGLSGFVVLAAAEYGGELELLVESDEAVAGCPDCGVVARCHCRRDHLVRDIPVPGRSVLLAWRKRIWRCDELRCPRRTWTERTPLIRPRAALTERARWWACQRVGRDGDAVEAVRVELGVGSSTVMRAVREHGTPLVDDAGRLDEVTRLGVDEHVWRHAGRTRRTRFATGVVDLSPGRSPRLLDAVAGRTGAVYANWIAGQQQAWRERISVAALDPFRGYATPRCVSSCPTRSGCWTPFTWCGWVTRCLTRSAAGCIGHGYRNFDNYRLRLLLHCGIDLADSTHATNQKPPSTLRGVEPLCHAFPSHGSSCGCGQEMPARLSRPRRRRSGAARRPSFRRGSEPNHI